MNKYPLGKKRVVAAILGVSAVSIAAATIMVGMWLLESQTVAGDSSAIRIAQVKTSSGTYKENAGTPIFDNRAIPVVPPRVEPETTSRVLGLDTTSAESEKWIEVDLSDQKLTTWAGTKKVKEYPVSTGLAGSPTVKGEYRIWRKVLSQGYRGGSKAKGTYYYLPNVPYSLFFHKGYAIHAAYWHNDFGIRPRSHGCVNMAVETAKEVYEWASPVMPVGIRALNTTEDNPGTRIVIHE